MAARSRRTSRRPRRFSRRALWLATMRHGRASRSSQRRSPTALAIGFLLPRSGPLATSYDTRVGTARRAQPGGRDLAVGRRRRRRLGAAPRGTGGDRVPASSGSLRSGSAGRDGPPLVRSLGMVLAPLLGVLLLHLVLAVTGGRARAVAPAYAAVGALSIGLALVRDPFADEHCWSNCSDNVFLVTADERLAQIARDAAVDRARSRSACSRRASPRGGAGRGRCSSPSRAAGVASAASAIALLLVPDEDPSRTGFALLFAVRALTFAALGAGLAWVATRERRARAAVAHLVAARSVSTARRAGAGARRSRPAGRLSAARLRTDRRRRRCAAHAALRARADADRAPGAAGGDRRARHRPATGRR